MLGSQMLGPNLGDGKDGHHQPCVSLWAACDLDGKAGDFHLAPADEWNGMSNEIEHG